MFDSTDTLSAVSGDGSVREATVEAPAPTFYIGDTPILKGKVKHFFPSLRFYIEYMEIKIIDGYIHIWRSLKPVSPAV